MREFMQLLHACGADESVLIDAEPHVGSDVLLTMVPRLRERILAAGGEVRFRSRLEALVHRRGAPTGGGRERAGDGLPRSACWPSGTAPGTFTKCWPGRGVALAAKPFAVGVRLEMPQLRH